MSTAYLPTRAHRQAEAAIRVRGSLALAPAGAARIHGMAASYHFAEGWLFRTALVGGRRGRRAATGFGHIGHAS